MALLFGINFNTIFGCTEQDFSPVWDKEDKTKVTKVKENVKAWSPWRLRF